MSFWTLRRKFAALGVLLLLLVFGWGVVVVAVAVSGAREQAATADAIAVLAAAQDRGRAQRSDPVHLARPGFSDPRQPAPQRRLPPGGGDQGPPRLVVPTLTEALCASTAAA